MVVPQCGTFAIFLALWFFVKSILADFRRSKIAVGTILKARILVFEKMSHLKMSKIQNSELLKWSKWQFLTSWNQPKLISHKTEWQEKSWNCQTVYSQLGCPGLYTMWNLQKFTLTQKVRESNVSTKEVSRVDFTNLCWWEWIFRFSTLWITKCRLYSEFFGMNFGRFYHW